MIISCKIHNIDISMFHVYSILSFVTMSLTRAAKKVSLKAGTKRWLYGRKKRVGLVRRIKFMD